VTVTGWGCEQENCNIKEIPIVLREAQIPIVPNDVGMCWQVFVTFSFIAFLSQAFFQEYRNLLVVCTYQTN
jgi:hypothetical protein